MVPRRNEPPRRREAAVRGRGLPGPQEHHQPGLLRPDRHAQWTCQTPAAGGPRRHGRVKVHTGFSLLDKNKKKHNYRVCRTEQLFIIYFSLLKGTDKRPRV